MHVGAHAATKIQQAQQVKDKLFLSFPSSSLTDQRGTLLKTAEMQSMDFLALWFSSGVSLQAQATPKVLGLNVPLTAGRNKTLFVCGYTSSLQCGTHFNVHIQGWCVVFALRRKYVSECVATHAAYFSAIFCLAYIMCVFRVHTCNCWRCYG